MIRHIVLFRFRPDVTEDQIAQMFDALQQVRRDVPGVLSIHAGRSESPEQIERGFLHGFTADLTDWDALAAYQADPGHQRIGAAFTAACEGGRDGILVFDLQFSE